MTTSCKLSFNYLRSDVQSTEENGHGIARREKDEEREELESMAEGMEEADGQDSIFGLIGRSV